jgi:enhancing lycopene biosynthesis protein 2
MGATHVKTTHGDVVTDSTRKVFTTPCYMLNASIVQIAEGANNIVKAMLAAM